MANAFYIQEEWITDYKLSGNDLLIFARLASFTLNVGGYNGSIEWLGHSVGTTKRTAINVLEKLEKIGMIEKENKFIKCVFQPLTQGEKSALKGEKISPKTKGEKISPNGAKFSSKGEKISPKYNKEYNYTNKCSNSVIVEETTHTAHTLDFLFKSFESKITSEMDESCIRNLAKKFSTLEQAQVFADYCKSCRPTLHLGMVTKLFNEILDRACEWDAQGRPTPRAQKQPEQPPQPTPQILPQREMPEIGAKEAQNSGFAQWMVQVIDAIKIHPKFAKKSRMKDYLIAMQVTEQFPTPCDIEEINQYLSKI